MLPSGMEWAHILSYLPPISGNVTKFFFQFLMFDLYLTLGHMNFVMFHHFDLLVCILPFYFNWFGIIIA